LIESSGISTKTPHKADFSVGQKTYRILDLGLSLESNTDDFLCMFDRDYASFCVPSFDCPNRLSVAFQVSEIRGCATLRVNETSCAIEGHPSPAAYAYQAVSRKLMEQVDGFLVLHAGAVARDGEALIVSGSPGAGKTTLTLKLLESGCSFLSDDFCPIHKNTGFVHPFPRSLWVSRQSPYSAQVDREPPEILLRGTKIPLSPGSPSIPIADGPCRIKALICMDPDESADSWREVQIALKKEGEREFLDSLQALSGIHLESMNAGLCEWRIRYPANLSHAGKLKALFATHAHCLWNVYRVDRIAPDFTKEPVLMPISFHKAAFNVMSEMKQELPMGPDNWKGRVTGVFMRLAELLERVPCYRLSSGKLDAMSDLALQAAGWSGSRERKR
jgi:hypothetical protein